MTDRPIIFSAPMVRALLDGRKTQTRRVLRGHWQQELEGHDRVKTWFAPPDVPAQGLPNRWAQSGIWAEKHGPRGYNKFLGYSPFRPGDRLWVREAWAEHHPAGVQDGRFSIEGRAGIPGPPSVAYRVIYRADGDPVRVWHCDGYPYRTTTGPRDELAAKYPAVCSELPGWCSPIHMPRWASRLTLAVTDVRVQKLQDICYTEAEAEGFALPACGRFLVGHDKDGPVYCKSPVTAFASLWNTLHRRSAWGDNPWVIAVGFIVIRKNIDALQSAA